MVNVTLFQKGDITEILETNTIRLKTVQHNIKTWDAGAETSSLKKKRGCKKRIFKYLVKSSWRQSTKKVIIMLNRE